MALALGEPDIDKLKHELTDEQWQKWERFYAQEPWGEVRADMRGVSHVMHILGAAKDLRLMYPYWPGEDEIDEKLAELAQLEAKHDTPEHREKLKAARLAHRAAMKAKNG